MTTIYFKVDLPNGLSDITREADYFHNKNIFIDENGFTRERINLPPLSNTYNKFQCNDERMLNFLTFNDSIELFIYNYVTNKYDRIDKAVPNLRKANNLESMWRRHVLDDCYYPNYNFIGEIYG